jgi:hypothetical protein
MVVTESGICSLLPITASGKMTATGYIMTPTLAATRTFVGNSDMNLSGYARKVFVSLGNIGVKMSFKRTSPGKCLNFTMSRLKRSETFVDI